MESLAYKSFYDSYKNKNVLITGATGGIGSKLTQILSQLQANICIMSRSKDKIDEVFGRSKLFNHEIVELENPQSIREAFKRMMIKFEGRIDVIIICHGVFKAGGFYNHDHIEFDNTININTRSVLQLISLSTPFLKLSKGNILVMSSLESIIPNSQSFLNSVSKGMVNSLIQCSALELAPFGIRVNGIAPSITKTNFRKDFSKDDNENYLESMKEIHILGRDIIKPNDVINGILFLCSDDAKFITGEILVIDNGYSLNHDLSFSSQN